MLLLAFLIGFFAGLRSLTAPAAMAWAVYWGWLKLEGPLALIGSLPAVAIFTVLAIVELVADKLPQTPSRTAPPGLIARIVMGGLTGACVAAAGSHRPGRPGDRRVSQMRAASVMTEGMIIAHAYLRTSRDDSSSNFHFTYLHVCSFTSPSCCLNDLNVFNYWNRSNSRGQS